jgi:hypothetical protein
MNSESQNKAGTKISCEHYLRLSFRLRHEINRSTSCAHRRQCASPFGSDEVVETRAIFASFFLTTHPLASMIRATGALRTVPIVAGPLARREPESGGGAVRMMGRVHPTYGTLWSLSCLSDDPRPAEHVR